MEKLMDQQRVMRITKALTDPTRFRILQAIAAAGESCCHAWQIANLASYGARLIPLGDLPQRLNGINPADDIVVYCKVGGRSAQAYDVLKHAGYRQIKHLKGGILAWADHVDRSMHKY